MVTIKIEGMSCNHCTGKVKKSLESIPGVTANVSLEDKAAYVEGSTDMEALKKAVTDKGFQVVSIV